MQCRILYLFLLLFLHVSARGSRIGGSRGKSSARTASRSKAYDIAKPTYRSSSSYSRLGLASAQMMRAYSSLNRNLGREGLRQQIRNSYSSRGALAAGLLGGVATGVVITNLSSPVYYNNRPYFWGRKYYDESSDTLLYSETCVVEVDDTDTDFGTMELPNNEKLKEIVFGCHEGMLCCDFDCCLASEFNDEDLEDLYEEQETSGFIYYFEWTLAILSFIVAVVSCYFRWPRTNKNHDLNDHGDVTQNSLDRGIQQQLIH